MGSPSTSYEQLEGEWNHLGATTKLLHNKLNGQDLKTVLYTRTQVNISTG